MSSIDQIIGYEDLSDTLIRSIRSKKIGNAMLFLGPPGVGKHTLIKYLISILSNNSSHSPDLIEISSEFNGIEDKKHKVISIDEIRNLSSKLRMTSANSGYRIAIIDGADDMNYNASNALLKILEEPGDSTLIFLTANSLSKMLPTIRSRCKVIRFAQINQSSFNRVLLTKIPDLTDDVINSLWQASKGNLGLAINIYNINALDYINKIQSCLDNLNYSYIIALINLAAKSRKNWEIVRDVIVNLAHTKLLSKARNNVVDMDSSLQKTKSLIDTLYNADHYNLDQSKTLMRCFV